ncbi:helix-turn-helix domain-containing protein [Sphingomonas histidinilytica]|uniref:XRE family transcriptional regulator n=1 Tax=Rhizorhabdus histidinilytica TaxID=439228 RepID=UPI001ADCD2D6|nr:helix-turn-helix transcriptional regulator [Rhizorhabdus histidinilytica]MBO9380266.1 helix-turn-helix domain-containing protein [Rhizorhabdus histidinilytica]
MNIDRLKTAMQAKRINQSQLAATVGISQGAMWQIIEGRTKKSKHLPDIARALDVPVDWLLGHDIAPGEIIRDDEGERVRLLELDIAYGMGGGAFIEGHVEAVPRDFDAGWLADITRSAPELLFVARGIGDSMMPTLLDNDTLLVDRGQRQILQQDRIWAITYGELGMIKRVRRRPDGKYLLMSDNPQISEIEALQDELHVVGRVVWIGRKV